MLKTGTAWRRLTSYHRDYYGGALMLLTGLGVIVQGQTYPIGTLRRMGPGFFPVALGVILCLAGIAIALGARRLQHTENETETASKPEWRGWICILAGTAAFALIGEHGGLLPASFAIVFISALGDRDNTIRSAFLLSAVICVISVVVFWWALQLQMPLFAWRN